MISTSPSLDRLRRVCLALLLALTTPGSLLAAESAPPPAPTQAVDLVYHETQTSFLNLGLDTTSVSAPFAKEPAVGAQTLRGKLKFGGAESNAIAFLWDRKAGKLFLDLNRNLDLTDDASGSFSTLRGLTGTYQSFTNVHLTLKTPAGERPLVGDLALWDYSSRPNGSFALRSLWQGRMTLQGEDLEIGLIGGGFERLDAGQSNWLLLRPWARHDRLFSTHDGSLQAVPFARKLFLNGRGYALTLTNAPADKPTTLQLQFREETPVLGEAKIAGQFIQRLLMEGSYTVVLDQPAAVVRIPVGSYSEPQVCLQSGDTSAYLETERIPGQRKVTVSEKTPAELVVGGPLTNSVTVSRQGSGLYLGYQLLGLGGRTYARINPDQTKPPEWTAFRSDQKVGSGKFEFG